MSYLSNSSSNLIWKVTTDGAPGRTWPCFLARRANLLLGTGGLDVEAPASILVLAEAVASTLVLVEAIASTLADVEAVTSAPPTLEMVVVRISSNRSSLALGEAIPPSPTT